MGCLFSIWATKTKQKKNKKAPKIKQTKKNQQKNFNVIYFIYTNYLCSTLVEPNRCFFVGKKFLVFTLLFIPHYY